MTDNAKKFLEAVSKDEALKKELMTAKDTEEALTIAKAHGYELKAEDFEAAKWTSFLRTKWKLLPEAK